MNTTSKLRDYQLSMLQDLYKAWKRKRSVMVQMPTGTGKTHLMAAVIEKYADKGVLVVAHRRELIAQISQTLYGFGVEHGLIVSGKGIDLGRKVQVASIQTIARRLSHTPAFGHPTPAAPLRGEGSGCALLSPSLVIIDEAHHAVADSYRMLWDRWPEARFLGLTATPCRLNGAPFTDLFDVLVQSWSVREFIGRGWLSDLDYVSVKGDSPAVRKVAGLDRRGADGDYQTRQAALVLDTEESIGRLYRSYRQFAFGKKGIVYAISRDHAHHIASYYQARGVRCAVIDAKTPAEERQRIINEYKLQTPPLTPFPGYARLPVAFPLDGRGAAAQKIDVLVNCEIFGEGFDVPEVEFIQLARPTLSLSLFLQQVGRGMRVSEGKDRVIVLDHVGLYLSMGLPTAERDWQGMFLGGIKGKGQPLSAYRMTEAEAAVNKMLADEEMVRLSDFERLKAVLQDEQALRQRQQESAERRRQLERSARARREAARAARAWERAKAEWHGPLGIFKEKGRYGIMRNEGVCLPAAYEEIRVLHPEGGRYFALARLPLTPSGSSGLWTVVTKDGEDLHARMEGEFSELRDDVFAFRKTCHGRFVMLHWDARYDRYYEGMQRVKLGGVEFFADSSGGYTLRSAHDFRGKFRGEDVLFNDRLTIIGSDLFVKKGETAHYGIAGFLGDCVVVEADGNAPDRAADGCGNKGRWLLMASDGRKGDSLSGLPGGMTGFPQLRRLGLQRESLKKYGDRSRPSRDYQQEMLDSLEKSFRHSRRVLLQIPTGSGKNFVVSKVIRQEWQRKHPGGVFRHDEILLVTHRPELKRQISGSLERQGLPHAVISPRFSGPYGYGDLSLIDAQTVPLFAGNVNRNFSPALIIIDEVHAAGKGVCDMLMRRFPEARMLGLSATPCTDSEDCKSPKAGPLSMVFGRMLPSRSVKRLVAEGWLRDVDVKSFAAVGCSPGSAGAEQLYQSYSSEAKGKKGVVFASDSRCARSIADCYKRHGVKSEVIGFGDRADVQEVKLNDFTTGATQVLVCTDYFSGGMRCPDVDFVQLACTTVSLNTYLHQVGCAMHPGKDEEYGEDGTGVALRRLTVLDHAGMREKFGLPTDDRNWKQLFTGGSRQPVRKKENAGKTKDTTAEPPPAAHTKWQLRMQRLLG